MDVDALLVSQDHGLVAFLLAEGQPTTGVEWDPYVETQDRLYSALVATLRRHDGLRHGRRLAVEPITATLFPAPVSPPNADGFFGELAQVADFVSGLDPLSPELIRRLEAALQRVTTIKPAKKRASVTKPNSRGAIMKEIEKGIANLDRWQKSAAIESPESPQRIRGLAGSGKTVVLSLKAAYWHTQYPDWNIALTFSSRALYQQITDLVERFTFEHSADKPDYSRIHILHSWGSASRRGLYSQLAAALGQPARDYAYARGKFGMEEGFRGVCRELLDIALSQRRVKPIFDAVLIDEAQDLPPEFFQLIYMFTKDPKRIVWGYDELQKLSESAMPTTVELFGVNENGQSRVSLEAAKDAPQRDIVLPVCYRNTPWALATAHALGTGIYRKPGGLVQHPDEPDLWSDIGYQVDSGSLDPGQGVTLSRRPDSSPDYFDRYLSANDAVTCSVFDSESAQDTWVAEQIRTNLDKDELEPDDILIVLPDTYRAKTRGSRLMTVLRKHRIESHLVGVTASQDAVFAPDSVAIAHIHRAKGNEAPMVYVMDAQYAESGRNIVTRRNTLFTAITRSRAWVRIVGWGPDMSPIAEEINSTKKNDFKLTFTVPSAADLRELRHIYRDRSEEYEESVRKATEGLNVFLEAFGRGDLDFADLSPELRTRLIQSLKRGDESSENGD
ncbi:superfamily I DNA and RNA helicase [Nocardia kruczakiae]|uniref:Superfamily I DNA and RNA helicase n=1 Tax=Nocardia kruczakiae TaxID=261477 RepID=A0ABU1XG56_9NOCA|nr:ATP-binding domain-containing protein [Nocardia kruczakiae]MDR7168947.1 superfamily I DNA and RNA helicase [Nocardia kruczakiae]